MSVSVPVYSQVVWGVATQTVMPGRGLEGLLPPQEVRFGGRRGGGFPSDIGFLVGHGRDDLGESRGPFVEQAADRFGHLILISAGSHTLTIPRVTGHCCANWPRRRMMAWDFNCEMRDS